MKSSIVVFVLVFAAMGLLIGYAASIDVPMQQEPAFMTTTGMNSTSAVEIEEQVQVDVEKAEE